MKRFLRALLGGIALLVLLAGSAFAWLAWQVNRLGSMEGARSSDVIVVLGARVESNGAPGPDLRSRTEHAVNLWRMGYAPQIICTGGYRNELLSAAAVCRRTVQQLGVPANRVWLADGSQNTQED